MKESVFLLRKPKGAGVSVPDGARLLRSRAQAEKAARSARRAYWIASNASSLELLVGLRSVRAHCLLVLDRVAFARQEQLRTMFKRVLAADTELQFLDKGHLLDVVADDERADAFIAAVAVHEAGSLLLYRGDLSRLVVPFTFFEPSGDGTSPNFNDVGIEEYGYVIRLGDYEVASHAILYAYDVGYRRRAKARQLDLDDTFGGALKRCRLSRGLQPIDFEPEVCEREIRRIENEGVKPRAATIQRIASCLGVSAADIQSF